MNIFLSKSGTQMGLRYFNQDINNIREWIEYWAKIVECKHVHIVNEQKDRIKQAKPRLVVRGTVACTATESTLQNQSGRATRKMFAVKHCRCTWMG
jgi:uncharacterized protein YdiU (UPF0061 family)